MPRRPITNPLEYLRIARRRWVWILAPFLLIAAATTLVVRRLPKLYRSDALILVEPQKVPSDFVKPTVSSNVALRLESIQEQILSRTSLSQLIEQYSLYRHSGLSEDQQVALMRNHITVEPVSAPEVREQAITAFRISYANPSPVLAQQVTRKLAALYIAGNLTARSAQSQGTEQFIDGRLAAARQKLTALETELRNLRLHYMGSLPEQQSANLQVMNQLQTAIEANANALARAEQQRTYLTSLGQAVAQLAPGDGPLTAAASPDQVALRAAQSQLAVAEQMYTPAHPDVIRLKAKVKALTAQVNKQQTAAAQAPDSTAAGETALPLAQRSQVALLDAEIAHRAQNQKKLEAQLNTLQARIEQLPAVEQKLSGITNEYNVQKAGYDSLLQKKAAAATAAAMEQQAEGQEFRIVDPANLPEKPSSPNLPRLELMGALAGLLAGCGLAYAAEMRDPVVRSLEDVGFYTQVPTLAVVPLLPASPARARQLPAGRA